MLSRRSVLLSGLLLPAIAPAIAPVIARAAGPASVRLGILPFGTVSWEAETIVRARYDAAAGYRLETVRLATNDAARIAFLAGEVDFIVSDLLLAARLRNEGRAIKFIPYSTTEGALMVPAASPIRSVADLAGKRLGVAGGPLDKNWLLLRAFVKEQAGIDLASDAQPLYGAPPLLSNKLEGGDLDAALLFWNFCARLEAKGFRPLVGGGDIARSFGLAGEIALLGYVFDETAAARAATPIAPFAASSREAKRRLSTDEAAWQPIRGLMEAPDEPTFQALRRAFLAGVPKRPVAAERADAETLYGVLRRLGGEKLVGAGDSFPAGLYWEAGLPG